MNEENSETEAVDTSGSLLDSAPTSEAPTEQPTSEAIDVKLDGFDVSKVPEKFIDKESGVVKLEEILKSNSELEKSLHQRAPESYEVGDILEEYNLSFENEEQEQEITDLFKTHRISNDAAKEILSVYGKRVTEMAEQYGSPYDISDEMEKLKDNWGSNTDIRLQEISTYVEQNKLPPEVFTVSPLKTAAGIEMIYSMIKNSTGPTVMRNADTPVADLETQLTELMNNPLYFTQNSEGDKVRKRATALSSQIAEKN
jgi:hypothetical protein